MGRLRAGYLLRALFIVSTAVVLVVAGLVTAPARAATAAPSGVAAGARTALGARAERVAGTLAVGARMRLPGRVHGKRAGYRSRSHQVCHVRHRHVLAAEHSGTCVLRVRWRGHHRVRRYLVAAPAAAAPTRPLATAVTLPGRGTTGVPAGTVLRDVRPAGGVLRITAPGTVLKGVHVHGFVEVKAPDVTILNSLITGPDTAFTTSGTGLVKNVTPSAARLRIVNTTIAPTHPTTQLDGVLGSNATLWRVNIARTIDGVKIYGAGNVTVVSSWIHDLTSFAHDPAHAGGPTHNDGFQVQSGRNITLFANTVTGGSNSALQVTQDAGPVSLLRFNGNWVDDGSCTVNISRKNGPYMTGMQVNSNRFGRHQRTPGCAIIFDPADSDLRPTGDIWIDTGQPTGWKKGA